MKLLRIDLKRVYSCGYECLKSKAACLIIVWSFLTYIGYVSFSYSSVTNVSLLQGHAQAVNMGHNGFFALVYLLYGRYKLK